MKHLLEHYNLLFAMTILTAVAILLKCICAIVYQMLLRDSEHVTSTKNKWLRSMITKYEACYKLQMPIYDTDTFIRTYLEQYRLFGLSMNTLEKSDYFCGLTVSGCTLFGIMFGIYYGLPDRWILIHSMTLVLFLIFLPMSELIFQVRYKKKMLRLQLLNHFENNLRSRLEGQYLYPEKRAAYQQEYFQTEDKQLQPEKEKAEDKQMLPDNGQQPEAAATHHQTKEEPQQLEPDMQELLDSLLAENKITKELKETEEKLSAAATREKYQLVEEIIREYL